VETAGTKAEKFADGVRRSHFRRWPNCEVSAERLRGDVENLPVAPTIGNHPLLTRSIPMRHTLLIYQNTYTRNGLSQKDEDVFMHATGDTISELSATGEWVGGEES